MAQYMDPLIRSGAMWSCGRNAAFKPKRGLWSRFWNWLGFRPTSSAPVVRWNGLFKPGRPRY
jgi:hypothetical protein